MGLLPLWTDQSSYVVEWDAPEWARFEFEMVRSGSDSSIKAELSVRTTLPGFEELLMEGSINLLAPQTIIRWSKDVSARANGRGELDWQGMLQRACIEVKRSWRAGEPAILLRDAAEPDVPDYLLPPVVLGRSPTIIFGHGGVAKSLTALAMGVAIHSDDARLLMMEPSARKRVLLLDWEFDPWEHKKRLRELCGQQLPDIIYARAVGALRDQVDRVKKIIRDFDVGFMILDSIGPAVGGDPMNPEVALGFFTALRQLGLGALCTAHIAKNGDEETPFGSVFFHNMARMTWLVRKQQAEEEDAITIGLFNKKSNTGKLWSPVGLRYAWEAGRVSVERVDVRNVPDLAKSASVGSRILHLLREGGRKSTEEIAEELNAKFGTVKTTLSRLHHARQITVHSGGRPGAPAEWAIATPPSPADETAELDDLPWPA